MITKTPPASHGRAGEPRPGRHQRLQLGLARLQAGQAQLLAETEGKESGQQREE